MRAYVKGIRVEVELKDGWFTGTVTDVHLSDIGVLLFVQLDDGRLAFCGSDKCVRLLNNGSR